jgi:hypothetical protein
LGDHIVQLAGSPRGEQVSAPASANAAASATPMPRPAPVTNARLPSRRSDGIRSSAVAAFIPPLRVADISAAIAPNANIGLLGMA